MPDPTSTVSSKGQITIPVEVRDRLGLRSGDRVRFAFENDRTFLLPAHTDEDPFKQYIGAFPFEDPNHDSVSFWREMRGHDDFDKEDR